MNKKVLVTGTPGWLGSQFVEKLCKENYDVRCLVLDGVDTKSLAKLDIEIYKGDVTKPETLNGITKGIDIVFHLVGIIHPKLFRTQDWDRVNYWGMVNVLNEAIESGVKRFVYVSSNSVGGTSHYLMDECTFPKPYMVYGKSKLKAEDYIGTLGVLNEIESVIIRPCWYYGAGQPMRQTRLMQMIQNGRVPLFGNGQNLRSMTYIGSLCEALILAGEIKKAEELYWIADDRPYTTLEIYQTIADILKVELKTVKIPQIVSDFAMAADWTMQKFHMYQQEIHVVGEITKNIACSVEKAKRELGFKPRTSLREGMEESIEWCRERGLLK